MGMRRLGLAFSLFTSTSRVTKRTSLTHSTLFALWFDGFKRGENEATDDSSRAECLPLIYQSLYSLLLGSLSLSLSSSSSSSYHSSPQFPCIYQVDPSRPDASSRVRLGFTKREKEKLKKTRKDKRNIARGAVCSGGGYQKKEKKKKKKRVERGGGNCRIKGNEDGAVSEHNNLWLLAFPPFRLSICLSACVSLAFSRSVPARKARPRIRPFLLVYRTQCLSCLTIRQQATQRRIRRLYLFIPLRCLRRERKTGTE